MNPCPHCHSVSNAHLRSCPLSYDSAPAAPSATETAIEDAIQQVSDPERITVIPATPKTGAHKRASWDDYFFKLAAHVSSRATCPRAHIGCVIVDEVTHRVLATGYNGADRGDPHCDDVGCEMLAHHCVRALHAEANAADQLGPALGDHTIVGQHRVAYVAGGRPVCSHCAYLLHRAGVREVRTTWDGIE